MERVCWVDGLVVWVNEWSGDSGEGWPEVLGLRWGWEREWCEGRPEVLGLRWG